MKALAMMALSSMALGLVAAGGPTARTDAPSLTRPDYVAAPIHGFDVRLERALADEGSEVGQRARSALAIDLAVLADRVPVARLKELRAVPIFVSKNDPVTPCACYHPSAAWLENNGFDPGKAKAVEIANAGTYLEYRVTQRSILLHELSHALHDLHLRGADRPLKEHFDDVRENGTYRRVLRWSGAVDAHYGMTNVSEYFAETSEALFGLNDFYPFVRAELRAIDPKGAAVVEALWRGTDPDVAMDMNAGAPEIESLIRAEIPRLHAAFQAWFQGGADAAPFASIEGALAPSFRMVTPDGSIVERGPLLERLRGAAAKRTTVTLETNVLDVRVLDGMRALATYEELQAGEGEPRTIVSSALFERDPKAPGKVAWLYVHETYR